MTELEIGFFEEYKSVDSICRDMYQTEQGVTEYINQMEAMDLQGSRRVVNWNEKYKKLKHLRWIRNQIAHENSAPDLMENDLIELENFHKQLLNQKDPLAELLKAKRESEKQPLPKMRTDYSSFEKHKNDYDDDDYVSPVFIIGALGVAALVVLMILSYIM
ncbi:hypothetical protein SAMN05421493_1275 [Pseudobutyrivibrio sp. 49]|uniref:DUF6548 family protein n=1 Tax=Pseudobutyrivibrio sp. 49 TaxID=1855344 RepID=UPI000887AD46|nr:DUF6548 family protein [Pseudobutyrivibrio sp. 49]SDI77108.1 hypothetical protein SAMN05421493_1275 [Pseudobutyrivibrio sp. 49]